MTAFQWLAKKPPNLEKVVFVDIDYPELIDKKVHVILETPQLLDLLGAPDTAKDEDMIPLRTKNYIALGCDLANTVDLNDILKKTIDIMSCRVLCIAEVSITYMDVAATDSLIRWTGLLPDGVCEIIPRSSLIKPSLTPPSLLLPVRANFAKWARSPFCPENA